MSRPAPWRLKRITLITQLCIKCARLSLTGRRKELPRTIYTTFRELGGIYVKFLQILVLQSESFSSLQEYDIYDVYDQVQYDSIDINVLLHNELGVKASQLTLDNIMPFAAGSFGQVYKAEHQGRQVILKVLRPSIVRELGFDLRVLGLFSIVIDAFSFDSAINTRRVYKELARTTRIETDYLLEADYASSLYTRYQNHPYIFVPYTFRELSTSHVICQEYVGGVAATDLLRVSGQGVDPKEYIYQTLGSDLHTQLVGFGKEILSSVFNNNATYGDPHPGNIKFLPSNKVGLIDYGLQAPAPKNLQGFYQLIEQYRNVYNDQPDLPKYSRALLEMYGGDIIRAAKSLDEYFATDLNILDGITATAEGILENESERVKYLMENNKMMNLFGTVINKNNRFCLEYDLDGPELMRAANLCIALVNGLAMKKEVMRDIYNGVIEDLAGAKYGAAPSALHPETALEILASWLDQVSYKNPQLHRNIIRGGALRV